MLSPLCVDVYVQVTAALTATMASATIALAMACLMTE